MAKLDLEENDENGISHDVKGPKNGKCPALALKMGANEPHISPQPRCLPGHVIFDVEVGKQDDGRVGGQKDQDVPGPVKVGEPN